MELITIPAHHTSNSYTTLDTANDYISSFSTSAASWLELSDSQRKYALIQAAFALNSFSYRGRKITLNQKLAFPRYFNNEDELANFFSITFTLLFEDKEVSVSGKRFISAANLFEGIKLNQLIKVDGNYFTIVDCDPDGNWIDVKETITDTATKNRTVVASDINGIHENIELAQIEVATQVINTRMFQQEVGEAVEGAISSFNLTGALSIRYSNEIFNKRSKFEDSGPLDLIYNLLNPWLAGIKGGIV